MRLIEVVTIISISLLLVLACYFIFTSKPNGRSFRWIGVFMLLLAANFLDGLLLLDGFYLRYPRLAGWEEAFVLLFGPSLLFFARSTTDPPFRWSRRNVLHLIPFIVAEVLVVGMYQSLDADQQRLILSSAVTLETPASVIVVQLIALSHFFAYGMYARSVVQRYRQKLKQSYSTRLFAWASAVFNYLLLLFALSLLATLLRLADSPDAYLFVVLVIVAATACILFIVLVRALDQPILPIEVRKSAESKLGSDEIERIADKIRRFFVEDAGYADPDLTISELAGQLAEPVRDVSHVVNHRLARNFYDLVNGYRIEAAERLLAGEEGAGSTIIDIMYRVGFNSKSSFNTQFRQKTGLTPSQYRRKALAGA